MRSYLEPQTSQHPQGAVEKTQKTTRFLHWMSQEVSKSIITIYNLPINGIYRGYNPLILTFDPNFQRDIQSGNSVVRV